MLWLSSGFWLGIFEALFLLVGRWFVRVVQGLVVPCLPRVAAWVWPALVALLALPAEVVLGLRLFSGPGINRLAIALVGPWLVPIAGTVTVVVATRLFLAASLATAMRRRMTGVVFSLVPVILLWAAADIIPAGYGFLWDATVVGALLSLQCGLRLVLPIPPPTNPSFASGMLLLGGLAGSTVAVIQWPANPVAMAALHDDDHPSGRLAALWRQGLDFDGDGFSSVLGGGDCNDFDASINPLAPEIPGDGIDQDCDGVDLSAAQAQARQAFWSHHSWARPAEPSGGREGPVATGRRSVIVVSVDALRADALRPGQQSPQVAVTDLWQHSVHFDHAYAPSSSTRLSLPILVSSRLSPASTDAAPTLPQRLRAIGYRTGLAAFAHPITFTAERRLELHPPFDLRVGFERIDLVPDSEAESGLLGAGSKVSHDAQVVDLALAMAQELANGPAPFFLWVHLFDLHQWEEIVPPTEKGGDRMRYARAADASLTQVGRLLDGLQDLLRSQPPIVVMLADHGEGLGERGYRHHTRFVYDFLVRVPLLFQVPGLAPKTIGEPVSLFDVMPTLLALTGAGPCTDCVGDDLSPLLFSNVSPPDRAILLRDNDQVALVRRGWKLLLAPRGNRVELYSLDDERPEAESSAAHPDIAREMLGLLRASPLRDLPPLGLR